MTPFEEKFPNAVKGVTEFVSLVDEHTTRKGDVITLEEDLGCDDPYFFNKNKMSFHWININDIKLKENTMNKTIKVVNGNIEIPEGYKVVSIQVEQEVNKRPRGWKELDSVNGFYVDDCSSVRDYGFGIEPVSGNKNIWPTKELAEASLAMSQLMQFRQVWVDGWVPDWSSRSIVTYCIVFKNDTPIVDSWLNRRRSISFPTREMAQDFLEAHKELIETAKPLL